MAKVIDHSIIFYGGKKGYQSNRSQINLTGPDGKPVAWIRFNDPGMSFETDSKEDGIVRMHLPSNMMHSVLHMLHHGKNIEVNFRAGCGFLSAT